MLRVPLFSYLLINDLVNYLREKCSNGVFVSEEIEGLLAPKYADDIAAFADTVSALQRLINWIESFCESVHMKIYLSKTKIVVFRNGGVLKHNESWTYQGQPIELVSFYKYLGLFITPKLV